MVEPTDRDLEELRAADLLADKLVDRYKAGDMDAFGELYSLFFDRVFAYLRMVIKDVHEAEDGAQEVFVKLMESLPRYERRGKSFSTYLFTVARNHALNLIRDRERTEPMDPAELDRMREASGGSEEIELKALVLTLDKDLVFLIGRLPLPQRQVLVMRWLLDMRAAEIAKVLDRTAEDVRMLQSRGQRFLRERLIALGRRPEFEREDERDQSMTARVTEATVLRARRFSIWR